MRKPHYWAFSLSASSVVAVCHFFILFPFRTSNLLLDLLLDLDTYGGVDPLGVFLPFLKKGADIIASKRSIVFRMLIRLGSFPECWRSANVTAILKGAPSPEGKTTDPYQ